MFAKLLLAFVITLFSTTYALADTITFDALNGAVGTRIEGAFTYTLSAGNGWLLTSSFGNPASGLITLGNFTDLGSTIDIFLTGGGLFTFTSFQIACAACAFNDPPFELTDPQAVDIIGLNGGSPTNILLNQSNSLVPTSFTTINSPTPNAQFDRLRIRISRLGTGRQVLDNINLTPIGAVAEPATLLLLISGLAGLTGMGFSRSRKK